MNTQKTHEINGKSYTFQIITADEIGCYDYRYWVICKQTQHLIGTNNKRKASLLMNQIKLWDWGYFELTNERTYNF